ncbi:helix-turn-helix domain-containing protein [Gulosibacter hominis]|uniref:helix-turn-helix domain-containing protein n=1 Tax=Gulosibacter hominis TaxID=2770504 RepID=UPI0019192174|nr:helix-turn-helix domain-containing protein [Gulosibacter hominis]
MSTPVHGWHNKQEAAELLGVSVRTIERMINRGELPARKITSRIVRIPASALKNPELGKPANEWAARSA